MGKKAVVVLLVGLAFPSLRLAQAQQQAKIPKIGVLRAQPASSPAPSNELFLRAFRELGYFEGKNIAFETRSAEGKLDRFPALADELVRLKVDVLVAYSTSAALAAKNAAAPERDGVKGKLNQPVKRRRLSSPYRRVYCGLLPLVQNLFSCTLFVGYGIAGSLLIRGQDR